MCFFYIELWIAFFFNAIVVYKVISVLRYVALTSDGSWIRKLRFYPLILIICWAWGTAYKICTLVNPDLDENGISWLVFLHIFFCSLQGTFNALIYGLNASVKKICKVHFCCCCYKDAAQMENMQNNLNGGVEMDSMSKNTRQSLSSTWSYDPRDSIPDLPQHNKKNTIMMKEITEYVLE